jgi:hypothetical protein
MTIAPGIHPVFKAIWPKLKEAFMGLKFKPENHRRATRTILAEISAVLLLVLAVFILIRIF